MKFMRLFSLLMLAMLLSQESFAAISQREFNEVIRTVTAIYRPIAKEAGGNLSILSTWDSTVINASAEREYRTPNWLVLTFGGLARLPQMTRDGFVIVLCHEIGHHLGGYPKKKENDATIWSSTEGQADYFATSKCARRIFANDDNEAIVKKLNPPEFLTESCRKSFSNENEINICIRSAFAGKSITDSTEILMASKLNTTPHILSFEITAPAAKANFIDENHSNNQCRLNTFLQGSLCDKNINEKLSDKSDSVGNCSKKNGDTIGLRPDCWFNPNSN